SFSATFGPQPASAVSAVSPTAARAGAGRAARLAKPGLAGPVCGGRVCEDQDRVDLEGRPLRKRRDLDGRTRRVRGVEILGHHRIDLGEVPQVGEVKAEPRHLVERATGRRAHRLEVVEGPARLRLDVATDDLAGCRVQRDLARQEY